MVIVFNLIRCFFAFQLCEDAYSSPEKLLLHYDSSKHAEVRYDFEISETFKEEHYVRESQVVFVIKLIITLEGRYMRNHFFYRSIYFSEISDHRDKYGV